MAANAHPASSSTAGRSQGFQEQLTVEPAQPAGHAASAVPVVQMLVAPQIHLVYFRKQLSG